MKRSRARRTMPMEAVLIPGLPDCLALECLLRLPFHAILDARAVCKRWKHELDSPSFYSIRRAAGLAPHVVSLLLRGKLPHTVGNFHLALYEPDTGVCTMRQLAPDRPAMQRLPPYFPNHPNVRISSSNAAVVGRELVVIGGWDVLKTRRTNEVYIYDLHSGVCRPGAPNPAPNRPFCRHFLKRGKMFVVGGRDAEGKKLRSVLVYDVAADAWLEMPDLGEDTFTSIDGSFCNFCDKFWRSREEYNSAILSCRKNLLLDDEDDLRLYRTEEKKEILVCVPEEKKSDPPGEKSEKVMVTEFILDQDALRNLRQRIGILPNEFGLYLESYYRGRL